MRKKTAIRKQAESDAFWESMREIGMPDYLIEEARSIKIPNYSIPGALAFVVVCLVGFWLWVLIVTAVLRII